MARTKQTARKKTGPKGVPRHQLAPRTSGASSSYTPNPNEMSRVDLIAELERVQEEMSIIINDRYVCAERIGAYQGDACQMRKTIHHLKDRLGKKEVEAEKLQELVQGYKDQEEVYESQIRHRIIDHRNTQRVLDYMTNERNASLVRENALRGQIQMQDFHIHNVEAWGAHLHEEVHRLTNLMDPEYQREVVAGDLGLVDNEVAQESEAEASAEEEDPEEVVPANDDGDHDDVDSHDDA
jgi:hypothetical protein